MKQNQEYICQEMFYLMNLELDGEISAEEQKQLDGHRANCPYCAALSAELAQMQLAVQSVDDVDVPEGFKARVLEQIQRESATPKIIPFRQKLIRYGSLAACAVLCIGLYQSGVFQFNGGSMSSSTSDSAAPMAVSTTTATSEGTQNTYAAPAMDDGTAEMAVEDRAVAEIYELETEPETEVFTNSTTTAATVDTGGGQTLPEQVAELLGVEEIAWVMIDAHEVPDVLPDGVEGGIVTARSCSYFVVTAEHWEDVRQLFGFGESIEAVEADVPCIVIIMPG